MYTRRIIAIAAVLAFLLVTACSISYKFNSASINYDVIKTITIHEFPNQAPRVYPPLSQMLTEEMKDLYNRKTRLQQVQQNGDLEIEGEITGYDETPMAVQEDSYASNSKLTITVRVRYTNKHDPDKDFEQTFSAYREYPASRMLNDVEEELATDIIEEIIDQIFNATVANW
ncbi:LPS assembly lipoprotein LptE [Parabacteroides sp. OttesenSCG-928-G06]|nr:LPS assembly lipoprotein LptE [Parabacteroides sp. OttesenSCG-928-K15]MDL2281616.1 LPS assembly lipoprotein LptE [Parabacteroides sp. OttesenSCG-928-G06]